MLKKELLLACFADEPSSITLTASYTTTAYSEGIDQVDFEAQWSGGSAPYTLSVNGITIATINEVEDTYTYRDSWIENVSPGIPEIVQVTDTLGEYAVYRFEQSQSEDTE